MLSVRFAAADPIDDGAWLEQLDSGELDDRAIDDRELDDQELDELVAAAIDALSDDQLEELGFGRAADTGELGFARAADSGELGFGRAADTGELGFGRAADTLARARAAGEPRTRDAVRTRSPIGRVELSLIFRRHDPIASERRDELLLVGTWRP